MVQDRVNEHSHLIECEPIFSPILFNEREPVFSIPISKELGTFRYYSKKPIIKHRTEFFFALLIDLERSDQPPLDLARNRLPILTRLRQQRMEARSDPDRKLGLGA